MKILIGIDTGVHTGFAVAFDHGEANNCAKLSRVQVQEIRELAKEGERWILTKLAKKYGVSVSIISMIKSGKRW